MLAFMCTHTSVHILSTSNRLTLTELRFDGTIYTIKVISSVVLLFLKSGHADRDFLLSATYRGLISMNYLILAFPANFTKCMMMMVPGIKILYESEVNGE